MLKWTLPLFLLAATPNLQADFWTKVKGAFSAEEQKEKTIRVLIGEEKEGVMLQVTGSHNIFDPKDGRRLATRFKGKSAFIQPLKTGIKWGEAFPKTFQLVFVPDHEHSTVLIDGTQYEGSMYVYSVGGKLNLVNEVSVETYLTSRLSEQSGLPDQAEALNAVAIVARTDAYYRSTKSKNEFWDVRAADVDYHGMARTKSTPTVRQAVINTRGMVMNAPGASSAFAAQWTEHSAGRTIPYHLMYRQDAGGPAIGVKSVVAEADRGSTEWSYTVAKKELGHMLGVQNLSDVTLHVENESGKIVMVYLSDGSFSKPIDYATLRDALGANHLRSSDFTVTEDEQTISFHGVGRGAGVGLCLYSADQMAKRGESASAILNTFFPSSRIAMISKEKAPAPRKRARRSSRA